MRRRIIMLVAFPVAAGLARVVASQLEKRGHTQAGQRARRAADTIRPQRGTAKA